MRRRLSMLLAGCLVALLWCGSARPASAQQYNLNPFFYYPYYYFPHNYWPATGPAYPEQPGMPYRPPPAYMALPPFKEPGWRYEYWQPQRYYRGSHFWLDVF
jgi:hypothetical protein